MHLCLSVHLPIDHITCVRVREIEYEFVSERVLLRCCLLYASMSIYACIESYHVHVCVCVCVRETECAFVSEGVAEALFTVGAHVYRLAQQQSCVTHESMCVCMRSSLPGGEDP